MTAPERIWTASTNGKCHVGFDAPSLNYTNEYIRADLAAVQPAQVRDLISRMDAIQACQVGPSDEWAKATKSGYDQAATDCQRNILRIKPAAIEPQPDPRDEVIKGLVSAADGLISYLIDKTESEIGRECRDRDLPVELRRVRAALAAAKAVQHG